MRFADHALARRIEAAEAANARACAAPDANAGSSAVIEAAGGFAVFAGPESPLTHAVGMGMNGPVREAEIDAVEAFFRCRGARPAFELAPLADSRLFEMLGERGYRIGEFNNVLVKQLAGTEIGLTPRVRRTVAGDEDLWAHTLGHGFFENPELTTAEMNIGRDLFRMPGVLCFLASLGGHVAGGGAMAVRDGLAMLFADATVSGYRRLGLQRELIAARLNEAVAQSCDLAAAATLPGSQSQRNYERMGFEVVYTRVTLTG